MSGENENIKTNEEDFLVPNLTWLYPDCTVCDDGGNVASDGAAFYCQKCGTTWDARGEQGERTGGG